MKIKKKDFQQHLFHENEKEDLEEAYKYLDEILPSVGYVVVHFNALEKSLDRIICDIFSMRSDNIGLIVLHKMNFSAKVDLFKRFSDDFHSTTNISINGYEQLVNDLKESGRLRNLVIHADWESTDDENFTYVKFNISKKGMQQEYVQFSEESLTKIVLLIMRTRDDLFDYIDEKNVKLFN